MKFKITYLLILFAFVISSDGIAQISSDSLIISKYKNDTLGMTEMDQRIGAIPLRESRGSISIKNPLNRRRFFETYKEHKKKKIRTIKDACKWMSLAMTMDQKDKYHPDKLLNCEYKKVEDGFLIRGENHHSTDMVFSYRTRRFILYHVGYNHLITLIQTNIRTDKPPFPSSWTVSLDSLFFNHDTIPDISTIDEFSAPEFKDDEYTFEEFVKKKAHYPFIAIEEGIQGRVIVRLIIDENGRVDEFKVVRGTSRSIDKSAMQLAESTLEKWTSAKLNGENIKVNVHIALTFRLIL